MSDLMGDVSSRVEIIHPARFEGTILTPSLIVEEGDGVVQLASGGGGPTSINADTIFRLDVRHGGSPSQVQKKEKTSDGMNDDRPTGFYRVNFGQTTVQNQSVDPAACLLWTGGGGGRHRVVRRPGHPTPRAHGGGPGAPRPPAAA